VAFLAPVSLDLGYRHSVHANSGERVADLVELEWLYDRRDNFHGLQSPFPVTRDVDRHFRKRRRDSTLRTHAALA
jgi:hypothetical protein